MSQEKHTEVVNLNDKLISFYETGKRVPSIYPLIEIVEGIEANTWNASSTEVKTWLAAN